MNVSDPSLAHISEEEMLLYCLDEIESPLKEQIEAHLQSCSDCHTLFVSTQEYAELILNASLHSSVSPSVMQTEHHDLMRQIYLADDSPDARRSPWVRHAGTALAIAASLIVGFFAGQWQSLSPGKNDRVELLSNYQMAENSDVRFDEKTGEMLVSVPQIDHLTVKGTLKTREIQRFAQLILTHDDRDDVRLGVMKMIDSALLSENEPLFRSVLHVAEYDSNPGLRLKALRLLSRLPASPELIAVLKRILLKDEVEGVRIQAAQYLAANDYQAHAAFIKQIAKDNPFMQSLVIRAEMLYSS